MSLVVYNPIQLVTLHYTKHDNLLQLLMTQDSESPLDCLNMIRHQQTQLRHEAHVRYPPFTPDSSSVRQVVTCSCICCPSVEVVTFFTQWSSAGESIKSPQTAQTGNVTGAHSASTTHVYIALGNHLFIKEEPLSVH